MFSYIFWKLNGSNTRNIQSVSSLIFLLPVTSTFIEPAESKIRLHVFENSCRDCDTLAWFTRFLDTVFNGIVPIKTSLEVSEMLLELEEATMDIVNEVHEDVNTEDDEEMDDEPGNSSDEEDIVSEQFVIVVVLFN